MPLARIAADSEPTMMCCVIARFNYMYGRDRHTAQVSFPAPPPPVPFIRHGVHALARVPPWWMAWFQESPNVKTPAGEPLSKIFDIGMFIPHIGKNSLFLLALLTLMSSSQGHFGLSRVRLKTHSGEGPLAVAIGIFVNVQLNCNDALPVPKLQPFSLPLPTGVLLVPNTVVGGMTWGDFFVGLLSMVLSSLVTALIGVGLHLRSKLLNKAIAKLGVRLPWVRRMAALKRFKHRQFEKAHPVADARLERVWGMLQGWLMGSPSGYSATSDPHAPVRWLWNAPLGSTLNSDNEIVFNITIPNIQGIVEPEARGVVQYYQSPKIPTFPSQPPPLR